MKAKAGDCCASTLIQVPIGRDGIGDLSVPLNAKDVHLRCTPMKETMPNRSPNLVIQCVPLAIWKREHSATCSRSVKMTIRQATRQQNSMACALKHHEMASPPCGHLGAKKLEA